MPDTIEKHHSNIGTGETANHRTEDKFREEAVPQLGTKPKGEANDASKDPNGPLKTYVRSLLEKSNFNLKPEELKLVGDAECSLIDANMGNFRKAITDLRNKFGDPKLSDYGMGNEMAGIVITPIGAPPSIAVSKEHFYIYPSIFKPNHGPSVKTEIALDETPTSERVVKLNIDKEGISVDKEMVSPTPESIASDIQADFVKGLFRNFAYDSITRVNPYAYPVAGSVQEALVNGDANDLVSALSFLTPDKIRRIVGENLSEPPNAYLNYLEQSLKNCGTTTVHIQQSDNPNSFDVWSDKGKYAVHVEQGRTFIRELQRGTEGNLVPGKYTADTSDVIVLGDISNEIRSNMKDLMTKN